MATGINKRHSRRCRSREGGACNCSPSYEASVYSKRDGKKIRRTFRNAQEAKAWRGHALSGLSNGSLRAPQPTTVQEAWDAWEAGVNAGTITSRSGDPYKPAAIRSYERAMRLRVLPAMGAVRLADIRRPDLQRFVNALQASGLHASTVQTTLMPLRAIFREALVWAT